MKIIIKFSPEITIKSRSVRILFIKILTKNIRIILKNNNQLASIVRYWDYIEIKHENNNYLHISKILINIPGIHHFLLVQDSIINSVEDIYHQITLINFNRLSGKTFCVRVKRHGNHTFTSPEIERYLGNKLCNSIHDTHVNLTKPDEILYLEIKDNHLFIVIKRYKGLGGLPIGTQQESLSLISGGFDSAVASYMFIRRGSKVHYCFFNLIGGILHTIEVCKIVYYLWKKFSDSHKVKFISVDFSGVVKEISSNIKSNYVGIILKRMMIRTASLIASDWKIKALITGEVLGQVSSQTIDNLVLVNNVVSDNCIILRPLIVYDKEAIIELAREIGTEIFSRTIPEYCGIISKKSTIKASKKHIELEENYLDPTILDKAISQAYIIDVNNISQFIMNHDVYEIETKTTLYDTDIILDIRTKNEQENNPLKLSLNIEIRKIPFYNLIEHFPKLNQNKTYLLYCERGIMSRLQAIHLYQKGFRNIKIYQSTN